MDGQLPHGDEEPEATEFRVLWNKNVWELILMKQSQGVHKNEIIKIIDLNWLKMRSHSGPCPYEPHLPSSQMISIFDVEPWFALLSIETDLCRFIVD